jgi:hypothetical protein
MENTERQKFDNAWRDAFQQAEQNPPVEIWSALDHELTRAEGGVMKRKVIFYQRLAAASVLVALAFGSLTTYYNRKQSISGVSEISSANKLNNTTGKENQDQTVSESKFAESQSNVGSPESASGLITTLSQPKSNQISTVENNQSTFLAQAKTDSIAKEVNRTHDQTVRKSTIAARTNKGLSLQDYPSINVEISGPLREVTIVRKLPAMPAFFMADTRKEKKSGEDLWASVGASAGSYSPQTNLNSNTLASAPTSVTGASAKSSGSSAYSQGSAYSVGLSVTKRVSNHWVLQGGLSYLNQAIGYTSTLATVTSANKATAFVADYATLNQSSSTVALTNPYEINSVNQFVSLPIQAGYLLIDRKVGWQLNTGLSTDIFLQNTLTDQSGQLDKYSEGAGENSPYRTLSWSALMGTELSYKIGTQYRVSLAPGLRYTMSPVLKSDVGSGNPIVWDLGFRFRYIFN